MARQNRFALPERLWYVFTGVALGAVWGIVMWILTGSDGGGRSLGYLTLTTAMIGGGVAGVLGTLRARRRGERALPRLPYRRRR